MRKNFSTILIVGAALLLASCVQQKESFSPVDYVNPLMGDGVYLCFFTWEYLSCGGGSLGNEFLESADRRER